MRYLLFLLITFAAFSCKQGDLAQKQGNVHQFDVPPISLLMEGEVDYLAALPHLAEMPRLICVGYAPGRTKSYLPSWQVLHYTKAGVTDTLVVFKSDPKQANTRFNKLGYHQRKLQQFSNSFESPRLPDNFAPADQSQQWLGRAYAKTGNKVITVNFTGQEGSSGIPLDSLSHYLNKHYSAHPKSPLLIIAGRSSHSKQSPTLAQASSDPCPHFFCFTSQAQLPWNKQKLEKMRQKAPRYWRILARLAEIRKPNSRDERFKLLSEAAGYAIDDGEADLMLADIRRLIPERYSDFMKHCPRHLEAVILSLERKQPWLATSPIYLTQEDRRGSGKQVLIVSDYRPYTNSFYHISLKVTTDRFGNTHLHIRTPGEDEFRSIPLLRNETISIDYFDEGYPKRLHLTDLGYQENLHDIHFNIVDVEAFR